MLRIVVLMDYSILIKSFHETFLRNEYPHNNLSYPQNVPMEQILSVNRTLFNFSDLIIAFIPNVNGI